MTLSKKLQNKMASQPDFSQWGKTLECFKKKSGIYILPENLYNRTINSSKLLVRLFQLKKQGKLKLTK
jgi:hypothetical protein